MSKHTDVPSWLGSPALAQLQSTQMYDDRAGDGARSRLMAAHPQILERSVPFCSPCWRSRHVPGPVDACAGKSWLLVWKIREAETLA